jgi:hypothetical protein
MNEIEVRIIEIAVSIAIAMASGLIVFCFNISSRVRGLEIYIMTSIKGAAEILHNDEDPYRIDQELEDIVKAYKDNHYDLTMTQWIRLRELCKQVMDNKDAPKGDRLAANTIYAFAVLADKFAEHKLMKFPK